jgi:hypothetical protein
MGVSFKGTKKDFLDFLTLADEGSTLSLLLRKKGKEWLRI